MINKAILRDTILLRLADVAPQGLSPAALLLFVQRSGFPALTEGGLAGELDYLAQKQVVVREESPLAAGVAWWKLAAAGREHLERGGLL
jgi:hypothetical protein